jgi:hypothetical protein
MTICGLRIGTAEAVPFTCHGNLQKSAAAFSDTPIFNEMVYHCFP